MAADISMAAVFGEAKADDEADAPPRRPVLFHAQGQGLLRIVATDLHSLAWHRSLDIDGLRDLQDDVGIAGSWSDFLDYLCSSLSSGQVSLRFPAAPQGPDTARLVATKGKGLPRITISLDTVAASALKDVIADFSLALYASYRTKQEHESRGTVVLVPCTSFIPDDDCFRSQFCFPSFAEQERVSQLMGTLASERGKNEVMQKQLEALSFLDKRKSAKPKLATDQVPSVSAPPPSSDQLVVPAHQKTSVASPARVPTAKATKRVAPAPRRARVRGALLQDTEENDGI